MLTKENLSVFRAKVASMANEGMGLALAFTFRGQSYVGITSAVVLDEAITDDYNAERLLREHDGIRLRQIDVVDGSKNMPQFRFALQLLRNAYPVPDGINWEAVETVACDCFATDPSHGTTPDGNDYDFIMNGVWVNAKGFGATVL